MNEVGRRAGPFVCSLPLISKDLHREEKLKLDGLEETILE
jgi:hypothetical protein